MRYSAIILFLSALALSCTKEAIDFPTTDCFWSDISADHPKNQQYQDVLDQYTSMGLPGVTVLVAKNREDLWVGASGVADIENELKIEPCHIMPVGGIGKLFCGTAAMLMVEDELLHLDAKIDDYLPPELSGKIPNSQSATIAHLLSHTSGIPDYADKPKVMLDLLNNKDFNFSRENVLQRYVYGKSSKFSPGTEYSFSNSNYEILTLIMDQVYQDGHADYYSFRLIRKLDLEKTYYKGETDYYSLNSHGMANGYFDRFSDGKLENATDLSLTIAYGQTGSDGIVSNVTDIYTFLKSVMTADIVTSTSLEQMKTYILKKVGSSTLKYGLGIEYRDHEIYGQAIGYSGSLPGYVSEAWYFPEENTYIVYQINAGNILTGPVQKLIDEDFKEAILSAVLTD